jgi:hypothetical protein
MIRLRHKTFSRSLPAVWKPRRTSNKKPRMEQPKVCSYCGGKVGQGFKEITIPKMVRIRICAPCQLSIFNWVMDQIKKEKNVQTTED